MWRWYWWLLSNMYKHWRKFHLWLYRWLCIKRWWNNLWWYLNSAYALLCAMWCVFINVNILPFPSPLCNVLVKQSLKSLCMYLYLHNMIRYYFYNVHVDESALKQLPFPSPLCNLLNTFIQTFCNTLFICLALD